MESVLLALGFSFQKGRIRISTLKNNEEIEFIEKTILNIDVDLTLPDLMDRYRRNFEEQIDHQKPDLIAAKMIYDTGNIDAAKFQVMPLGILASVCSTKKVPLREYVGTSLAASGPFKLPKGVKPIDVIDKNFGVHPPYWDAIHKASVLAAWRALLEA